MKSHKKKSFLILAVALVLAILFTHTAFVNSENYLPAPSLVYPGDNSIHAKNPGKLDWSDVDNTERYSLLISYPDGSKKTYLIPGESLSPKKFDLYGFFVKIFRLIFGSSDTTGYVSAESIVPSEFTISDEFWDSLSAGKYSWNVVAIDSSGNLGEFSSDFVFYKVKSDLTDYGWDSQKSARSKEANAVDSNIVGIYSKLPVNEKIRQAKNKKNLVEAYSGFSNKIDSRLLNSSFLAVEGYFDSQGRIPAIILFENGKSFSDKSVVVKRNFKIINGASVYLKQSEIGRLASSGNVRGIYLNEVVTIPKPFDNEEEQTVIDPSQDNRNLLINAPKAWELGYKGEGIVVAILDTGIDKNHPDLIGKIIAEESFVGGSANDGFGHGTHVASLVAGTGAVSNGKYQGVAPNAMLMNGKVLDNQGRGTLEGIIAGMEWAVNKNADIISMSLGGDVVNNLPEPLTEAANKAFDSGVVVVVAAGNSGWY